MFQNYFLVLLACSCVSFLAGYLMHRLYYAALRDSKRRSRSAVVSVEASESFIPMESTSDNYQRRMELNYADYLNLEKSLPDELKDYSRYNEYELMRTCQYWSRSTARDTEGNYVLKCAVNPSEPCKNCNSFKPAS